MINTTTTTTSATYTALRLLSLSFQSPIYISICVLYTTQRVSLVYITSYMAAGRSNLVGNFSHSQANSDYLESLRFFLLLLFYVCIPFLILSIVKSLSVKMTRDPSQQFSFKFLQLSIRFFFLSYCFLNYLFAFILLKWEETDDDDEDDRLERPPSKEVERCVYIIQSVCAMTAMCYAMCIIYYMARLYRCELAMSG